MVVGDEAVWLVGMIMVVVVGMQLGQCGGGGGSC